MLNVYFVGMLTFFPWYFPTFIISTQDIYCTYLFHPDKPAATSTLKKLFHLTSPDTSEEEKDASRK